MNSIQTMKVDLAGEAQDRSYDILIGTGLIDQAGALIAERLPGRRAVILTDSAVGPLYAGRMQASLQAAGIASKVMTIPRVRLPRALTYCRTC